MTEQHLSLWRHDTMPPVSPHRITMAEIALRVAEKHGITVEDLKGQSRSRPVAWPRQEAMYECRLATTQSLPAIGRFFGGRDHSTVIHAMREHQKRLQA